jgi:hypothetical protein
MWRRYPAICRTACLTLFACTVALFAADRPARVITPEDQPIWLDPQRTLVFDAPSLTVMQRNEDSQPVNYALRIWVFNESTHLKGIRTPAPSTRWEDTAAAASSFRSASPAYPCVTAPSSP